MDLLPLSPALKSLVAAYYFPGTRQQFAVAVKLAAVPVLFTVQDHVVLFPEALLDTSFMAVDALSQLPLLKP